MAQNRTTWLAMRPRGAGGGNRTRAATMRAGFRGGAILLALLLGLLAVLPAAAAWTTPGISASASGDAGQVPSSAGYDSMADSTGKALGPLASIAVTSTTTNGMYNDGDQVSLQVNFNVAVTVTGLPLLALNSGGTAAYTSGSGGTTLTFTYGVLAGQNATDLDYASTSALTLNGGTIQDAGGTDVPLTLPTPGTAGSLGANKNIVIDTVAPTVTVTSTASEPTGTSPIPFTVTFSESVTGFVTGDMLLTNGTFSGFSGSGTTYTFGVIPSASGTVTVMVYARVAQDAADNGNATGASLSRTYTPPTVAISAPANGSTTANSSVTVSGTAANATSVTVTFQGTNYGPLAVTGGNWSQALPGPLANGTYTVTAVSTNSEGANSTTATSTFTVARPTAVITTPANGSTVGNPAVTVTGTAANATSVTVTFQGTNYGPITVTGGNWTQALPGPLDNGTYTVTVVSTNGVTNSTTASSTFTVARATVAITAPANGGTLTTPNVTVSGTAANATSVTVTFQGTNYGPLAVTGGNWSQALPGPLADGTYTVTAVSANASGTNSTAASSTFTVAVPPPPAPVVVTPANGSLTNNPRPLVSGTAEANRSITIYFDGSSVGTTTADSSGNWAHTWTTALNDGSHTVKATASGVTGNTSADSNTNTFTVDTTPPPAPTITTPANGSTTANPNMTVSGTAANAASVTVTFEGTNYGPLAVTGGNWSQALPGPLADSTYTVTVAATDAAGNGGAPATASFTVDTTAPTVVVTSTSPDPTNANPIPVTVTFSEAVTDFAMTDVTVTNGTVSNFAGSGTSYTFDLVPTLPGAVTADIAAGVAQDAAGNGNVAATTPFSRAFDSIRPTVTIAQAAGQADPTNVGPITFTVVFSEAVTDFDSGDVTVGGTAGATTVLVTGSGMTYAVAVGGMVGPGTVTAALAAGVANDVAGNANTASTSSDNSVTFDDVVPTVAITATAPDPTNGSPIAVTVTFSEGVTGFEATDVMVTNGTVGDFTGGGTTYTFTVTPAGQGAVTVGVAAGMAIDSAGNGNLAATLLSRTFDNVAPTVAITPVAPDPRNSVVASITITFSEPVAGFDLADLRLTLNGGANLLTGAQSLTTADDTTWTLGNLTGLTGAGGGYALTLTVAGSGIGDAAGNGLAGDSTEQWTTDSAAPTVTIEQAAGQADPTAAGPIRFTVIFSKPVTGFDAADVALGGTASGTLTATVTGSGASYAVTVGGMATGGTVSATVRPGATTDVTGNASLASTSVDNTVTFQQQAALTVTTVGPGVVSPGNGQYPLGPVTLTATPNGAAVFTGWVIDGRVVGWGQTLTLNVTGPTNVTAMFAARPTFGDAPGGPAGEAIAQLAARGIIKGYGDGTFGPQDTLLRAQVAALIVRAFGWSDEVPANPAPFTDLSGVDAELQRAIAILAERGIIKGYGDGTFGPMEAVNHVQVVSFITRAMVQAGYWQQVTQDDASLYPNVPLSSGHRLDLLTFVRYAGALPDRPANQGWADWATSASRGWTAQVIWQALESYFQTNRVP